MKIGLCSLREPTPLCPYQAEESGGLVCNDERRDGSQIGLESTLGLESPPKFRASHELNDPRRNAARHINSASGAKGKRHIAGECSQESAESTKRLAAKTAMSGKRPARDFGRAKPGGIDAVDGGNCGK